MRKSVFHSISIALFCFSVSLFFWYFDLNLERFFTACSDVGEAVVLWFKTAVTRENKFGTVSFVPSYDFGKMFETIDFDVEAWSVKIKFLWSYIWDGRNFAMYWQWFFITVLELVLYLTIAYTVLIIIQTLLEIFLTSESDKPGKDTKALALYKKIEKPIARAFSAVVVYIKQFVDSPYWFWFNIVWLFNLNLASVVVEFVAFIFGYPLAASWELFWLFVGMLISDILIALASMPLVIWLVIFYAIFSRLRAARGDSVLKRMYSYDVGFLKSCAYNVLLTGPTGASKTKTAVQMAIMTEDYYHTDQWDSMYKYFQEFPEFPFFAFEQDLKKQIENGVINNMHTARNYVECLKCEIIKHREAERFYNYTGRMYYIDGVRRVPIWEMLEAYSQLYYMYTNDTSSIIANLSVRSDLKLVPGHFPLWDNNLLKRTHLHYDSYSRYCHILNNNMFRFSKLVDDEPSKVSLEYGVDIFTEHDKDQGNQYSNKQYDIKDDKANPLNDGYDLFLMLERHLGTVDYKCYIRNFADIQREGTLREGVKGLYDELNISEKAEPKLALPLFIEGWLFGKLDSWFNSFTQELKHFGNINTLPYYFLRRIIFPLSNWVRKIKHRYTFEEITFTIKSACSPEGVFKQHPFYLLYVVAHSNRYSTDCYSSLNDEAAKYSSGGIQDLPEYESIKPALHELPLHKSYFSNKQLERLERIKLQKRTN